MKPSLRFLCRPLQSPLDPEKTAVMLAFCAKSLNLLAPAKVLCQAHNLKVAVSNPVPATSVTCTWITHRSRPFLRARLRCPLSRGLRLELPRSRRSVTGLAWTGSDPFRTWSGNPIFCYLRNKNDFANQVMSTAAFRWGGVFCRKGFVVCVKSGTSTQNCARSAVAHLRGGVSGCGTGTRCVTAPSGADAIGRRAECNDLIGILRRCRDNSRCNPFRFNVVLLLRRGTVGLYRTRRGDGRPVHPPLVSLVLRGRRGARSDRRCLFGAGAAG